MKKIGLICMSLVLALGLGGVAYASWTDNVTITQTVTTGNVLAGVRDLGTNDNLIDVALGDEDGVPNPGWTGPVPDQVSKDPGWDTGAVTLYDKDVAHTESENVGGVKCTHNTDDFYDAVQLTVYNAYPSYAPLEVLEFANSGSIPVIVQDIQYSVVSDPDGLDPYVTVVKWEVWDPTPALWASGVGMIALEAAIEGLLQIDPCEVYTLKIWKHIEQEIGGVDCPQGKTATVKYEVTFIQWNEA